MGDCLIYYVSQRVPYFEHFVYFSVLRTLCRFVRLQIFHDRIKVLSLATAGACKRCIKMYVFTVCSSEAVPRTWYMKPELHYSAIGVPAGALSPPATLSPPSSPSVTLPPSPWSPGAAASSLNTAATSSNPSSASFTSLGQPTPDRFSAFTLVSTCNPDARLQSLPLTTTTTARGNTIASIVDTLRVFMQIHTILRGLFVYQVLRTITVICC